MDELLNLEDIPIHIEGVDLPSVPRTSNDPLIEENEESLIASDHEKSDENDMDDEGNFIFLGLSKAYKLLCLKNFNVGR